jgi:hypothetical protein
MIIDKDKDKNSCQHITRTIKVIEPVTGYRLPVTGLTPFIAGPLGGMSPSI